MARFTIAGHGEPYRVRVGSIVHYVDRVPLDAKPDIVREHVTDRGRTSLRPYVIGVGRHYKTLTAAVAALVKERT